MKKRRKIQLNIKSKKGFTLQDLVAAIIIFLIFTSTIVGLMSLAYQMSYKIRLTENATSYAIQIMEDIDKIAYEEVNSSLTETYYKEKFQIPGGYHIHLDINETALGTVKYDIVKEVKLTISYTLYGDDEEIVIDRYKIREL